MPGYFLVEQKSLTPPLPPGKGIPANRHKIGFLDFLRDLEKDEFPYNENSRLLVVGIEEVLLAAKPEMNLAAQEIRKVLQRAANDLTNCNCPDIQIVFKQPLQRGEKLVVNHISGMIPVHLIFGSPAPDEINGQVYFKAAFNLSSNR